MRLFPSLIVAIPVALSFADVQTQSEDPGCSNPGGVNGITAECWTSLAINQHVTDTYNATCHPGTSFAECFLQILDLGTMDCVGITSGSCPTPSWVEFQQLNISVKDYYIAYNIYSVWSFFNGYWTAIGNARSAATDSIGAIVALLDPPQQTNAPLDDILAALSVGLSFIAPEAGTLVTAVINGAQQAPNVAKYIFPTGTLNSQFAQFVSIRPTALCATVHEVDLLTSTGPNSEFDGNCDDVFAG